MKKKLIYNSLFTIGLVIASGCTKNFEKLNTDPTAFSATNFDPNYLLTTAQLDYTGSQDFSYDTWRADLIYCSDMIQGFATSIGYWAGDKYLANPEYTAAYWQSDNGGDGKKLPILGAYGQSQWGRFPGSALLRSPPRIPLAVKIPP